MIDVAILASRAMMRARLEAAVAEHPRLHRVSSPCALGTAGDAAPGQPGDVLLLDPGARPVERVLRALPPGQPSILDKLNARSRTEAVTLALRRGVLMV